MNLRLHRALYPPIVLLAALTSACAPTLQPLPGPLEYPRSPRQDSGINTPASDGRPTSTQIAAMPSQPLPLGTMTGGAVPGAVPPAVQSGPGDEVSMAIEQTPLPVFIQILYGSVLKQPYSLDPAVQSRTDLVTFKTSQPIGRDRMRGVAVNLLRSYGLAVQDFDGLVRILPEANAPATPILNRGRTLPDTPEPLRPVFQHVELEVARSAEVSQWFKQIVGNRVQVQDDPNRNGLLLSGTQSDLRMALDLVQALDQPRMRGRVARRITPAFTAVSEFANRLTEVLGAQGYAASTTLTGAVPILILPIPAISSVIVFTNSEATMEHTLRWARELDRPATGGTTNSLFTYPVRYADAQDLAKTLGDLLTSSGAASPPAAGPGVTAQPARNTNNRVVVNNATNTLIFRGTNAEETQQIQTLLRELDRPAKSALIEVVVAELRRTDAQSLGVQWDYNKFGVGGATENASAGGSGFNLAITFDGLRVRSLINALASNNLARVLSNPKLMARNGESATIQVGQEVPIITSQQSTGTSGGLFNTTPNLLQTVQYRSTGVILKVRPVINSGNRLDLEIQQEVSSAAATTTGVSASPTIATRRVETKLSLRDGSTLLMAGLIDRKTSGGNAGVPFLKDIPLLGALFRSTNSSLEETELIVMITPYVVNDDFEAEGISDAVQAGFGDWARTLKRARVTTAPQSESALPAYEPPPMPPSLGTELPASATPPPSAQQPPPVETLIVPSQPQQPGAATSRTPAVGAATPQVKSPAVTTMPSTTTTPRAPAPVASAPSAALPSRPATQGSRPPIAGGRVVEDEKTRQEVQRLFEGRK